MKSAEFTDVFLDLLKRSGVDCNPSNVNQLQEFLVWVSSQPKIETHVHMEAAVDSDFYQSRWDGWSLQNGLPWQRSPYENLRAFITAWVDLSKSVRTLNDFEAMAEAFVAGRARENILYSEVYVSPADFSFIRKRFGISEYVLEFESVLRSYVRGLQTGLARHPTVEVRLIVDTLWISTDEERQIILESLTSICSDPSCRDPQGISYIVGVGLGGMETHQSLEQQIVFMDQMRSMGLKVDIHSGEGGAPSLHRTSVETLVPDRVAHGFSAFNDGFLYSGSVVMCPLSNLLLRTYSGHPAEHPVFSCLKNEIPVCIGSDDPLLLGNSLALEYVFLHALTGQGRDIFRFTQKNAREQLLARGVFSRVEKHFLNGVV